MGGEGRRTDEEGWVGGGGVWEVRRRQEGHPKKMAKFGTGALTSDHIIFPESLLPLLP